MYFLLRLAAFASGLFVMGLGISLVAVAGLGTSPISSPSYVLSLVTPLSFGVWTLLFTAAFFLGEVAVYGRDAGRKLWLQLPMAPALGLIIDLFMNILPTRPEPSPVWTLPILAVGCLALALGIWMQVKANIVINPGEGIVKALAWRFKRPFGIIKLIFDASLVALALIFSLVFLKDIAGIGAGTLISALTVGPIVRFIDAIWLRRSLRASKQGRPGSRKRVRQTHRV